MTVATMNKPARNAPATAPVANGEQPVAEKFRRVKSETLTLRREKAIQAARDHLALPESPTERELDPKRVRHLTDRIAGGVWLPCQWATVLFNGIKYRMNGQHSSHAMVDAGDKLPEEVAIHLDHYEADDSQAMAILFRQFDARFSGRSKQDVAGAYQGLIPELQSVPRTKAKLGMEGVAWYERAIEGLPVPGGDELYQLFFLPKYHPFLRWLDKILTIKTPELRRAPIIGAMYATFITSESGAQEFWTHAAKQDLADDMDPRAVLSAELVAIKEDPSSSDAKLTPADFYGKCIKAWNAYRAGEKIRSLKINVKKGLPEIAA